MNTRIKCGWLATALWITLWAVLLSIDWANARDMGFNEWGDFFAGAFAPLAFLWLVIGYFQQGEELGQNTKALEQQERALQLQVKELKQSVEQQEKSAIALGLQSEIAGRVVLIDATYRVIENLDRKKRAILSPLDKDIAKRERLSNKIKDHESSIRDMLKKIELLISSLEK